MNNHENTFLSKLAVIAATALTLIFNWLAASGIIGSPTGEISLKYPTKITPAKYAFSIWALIYAGLISFSMYQAIIKNSPKLTKIRLLYVASCFLNATWLYLWGTERLFLTIPVILILLLCLAVINAELKEVQDLAEFWFVKFPFSTYFGWVTVATIANITITISAFDLDIISASIAGPFLIMLATILAIVICITLKNHFYPLPIAWGLTAIAINQGAENTGIIVSSVIGVIICLFMSMSFVLKMPSMKDSL